MKLYTWYYDSPLGRMTLESDGTSLSGLRFDGQNRFGAGGLVTGSSLPVFEETCRWLDSYFQGGEPYKGCWAFPGGFLRMDETAREGALRELREETALVPEAIRELGVFSAVDRDPRERVITVAYYALVKPSAVVGGDDAADAAWFPVDHLPELAFDHRQIFAAAMERLRRDIHFEPLGFDLLDERFTIPDLQRLYEIILGTQFDRRNFQRKILASGILEEIPMPEALGEEECERSVPRFMSMDDVPVEKSRVEQAKKRPGRLASLFRFKKEKYAEMKREGDKYEF